jgi:Calcium binding
LLRIRNPYQAMPKSKIDQAREERITHDIVVDCYNESERFSGWCCYLEDKLKFPFRARCVVMDPVSPLKRGEEVEVIGLIGDDRPSPGGIFAQIRWQGRKMGVPLAQLKGVEVDPETAEAIADWHYWCAQGYEF